MIAKNFSEMERSELDDNESFLVFLPQRLSGMQFSPESSLFSTEDHNNANRAHPVNELADLAEESEMRTNRLINLVTLEKEQDSLVS